MAYSGNIGVKTFNSLKVIDHAFRRCRLPAQAITSEMQEYALDSLAFMLDDLSNVRVPSWCIEKLILPFYQNQPIVTLPLGTVDVLNLNFRQPQLITGTVTTTNTSYVVNFTTATVVNTIGVKWSATAIPLTFQVSSDNNTWITVGTTNSIDLTSGVTAVSGQITWDDISGALPYQYFKIIPTDGVSTISYSKLTLGNMPMEIPLGQLNRDQYVNQSNTVYAGQPSTYYFQRNVAQSVVNIWPAPNLVSETTQLILWRQRSIMDTDNLQQEIEIPNRWLDAIVNGLASKVANETPSVDVNIVPLLEQRAAMSMQRAWDGDSDGSPIQINPGIGPYTR
tara:strand:- start:10879 stop:11889 length:1011 start_codon:yes stop_codon:yes gene_type:complete